MRSRAPASILVLSLSALVSLANAQPDASGSYRASALAVQTDVREWPTSCGPLPALPQGGGGPVEVRREGGQLVFSGAFRGRTTDCFWPDRDVDSVSTSHEPTRFTTICRSSEANATRTAVRVVVETEVDAIAFRSSATLEREVAGRRCVAGVTAVRSLVRTGAARPEPGAGSAAAPTGESHACSPGAPVSLRVRGPGRPLAPGERFCPVLEAADASGCPVPDVAATVSVAVPRGRTASFSGGCFTSSPSAAESEGHYRLDARHGALSSSAEIVVAATDLSDITAVTVRDRPRRTATTAEAGSASGMEARAVPRSRKVRIAAFVAVGSFLLLGTAAVLVLRRKRRTAQGGAGPGRR
ncbi:MAG: hypothetical protein U0230_14735 [Polyangiales bacterium]